MMSRHSFGAYGQLRSHVISGGLVDELLAPLAIELLDQIQIRVYRTPVYMRVLQPVVTLVHHSCACIGARFALQ